MEARQLFHVFDIVYQGLGNGLEDNNIFSVRYFTDVLDI